MLPDYIENHYTTAFQLLGVNSNDPLLLSGWYCIAQWIERYSAANRPVSDEDILLLLQKNFDLQNILRLCELDSFPIASKTSGLVYLINVVIRPFRLTGIRTVLFYQDNLCCVFTDNAVRGLSFETDGPLYCSLIRLCMQRVRYWLKLRQGMESTLMPQHICGRMTMEKLRKTIRGIPTFYGVYEDLKHEVMTYGGRSWNQDTTEQYDQIVKDYIVPFLDDSNRKHIGEIRREDYKKAIRKLIKRGKKSPGEPYEPWEKTGVPEKAEYLMRAVVWTAWKHELCDNWFDENAQSTDSGGRRKLAKGWGRIKKCLSIKQELSIVDYLMAIIYISGTAIGLLLQFALGLRNNEACGLNFGYIREFETHPGHYYLIIPQSTDLGASTVKILGKTKNSGRRIPLPKPLVNILFKLHALRVADANQLGYQGLAEDLPIVCKLGWPWERCASGDLSNAARTMFNRIGMRNDELVALNQELLEDAQAAREELNEDEFREIESDPTAYLLRRNFATHLAKLRLRDVETWYVIGHKIEDAYVQRRAFNDEKLLFALKLKLDERPVLNPIMLEKHVVLKPGESIQMDTSKQIKLEIPMEQVSKASIHVTAYEPGDHIHMKVTPKLTKGSAACDYTSHAVPLPAEPDRTIDGTRAYLETYLRNDAKELSDY